MEIQEKWETLAHRVKRENRVQLDLLDREVLVDYKVILDYKARRGLQGRRARMVKKDLLDILVYKDYLDYKVKEAKMDYRE